MYALVASFLIAVAAAYLRLDVDKSSAIVYGSAVILSVFSLNKLRRFLAVEWKLYNREVQSRGVSFELKEYVLFRVDCLYSRNHVFKAYLLLVSTFVIIAAGGGIWYLSTNSTLQESLWFAWTFVADPGTHADTKDVIERSIGIVITLGGMIIFALVIGIISEEVSTVMDGLRKGKCAVIAHNHTLILGHSDKLIPTIHQISLANKSLGGAPIVVLSEIDKLELEHTIRASELDFHGSEVIVRTGNPSLQTDLKRVSAESARSIIILSDRTQADADMADVNSVRIVLCLRAMDAPKNGHIVCEVCDVDNKELIAIVGKDAVETFVSHDIIGRLMIQCARERGLSFVLEALLGFEGDEFYIKQWPELEGLTFGEVLFRFESEPDRDNIRAECSRRFQSCRLFFPMPT